MGEVGLARVKESKVNLPGLDHLKLPDGRKASDVKGSELARVLLAADVPNASVHNGREANLRAYAAHLDAIASQAGKTDAEEWRADWQARLEKKGVAAK